KVNNMLAFLQDMEEIKELGAFPLWKVHRLKGDRKGTWSLSVTKNWRVTFMHDTEENEIYDLNFEDYH
ncbi:MAG: plasmid maintenance system killer, partial [Candidatus Dadabacteria bacterium]|nr:plasmid maintenance system killer [Candidatus Dadabacteria bacterium]